MAVPAENLTPSAPARRPKVLVADDEFNLRVLVRAVLEALPFDVIEASDGIEALAAARREKPDLLVLDWMMPGSTGLDIVRTLREEGNETPVILLTARGLSADRSEALDAGIDDFLSKPFSPAELARRVVTKLQPGAERGKSGDAYRHQYLEHADLPSLVEAIEQLDVKDHEVLQLLVGEKADVVPVDLHRELSQVDLSFTGGFFPEVFCGEQSGESAAVVAVLPAAGEPILVEGLSSGAPDLSHLPSARELVANETTTALIFVDGLTRGLASFLEALYERYGPGVKYLGGGAGSLSLEQAPCLLHSSGVREDCATVCFLSGSASLGVRHGYEPLAGPFVASNTEGCVVRSLNWTDALEVYRSVVEPEAGVEVTTGGFFEVSQGYPFGMMREGMEPVIRDPIAAQDDGSLTCIGEVPQNCHLTLMRGSSKGLVQAARRAAEDALVGTHGPSAALVFDCISRRAFLGSDFPKELQTLSEVLQAGGLEQPIFGALSLGEISSYGDRYVELFNKTVVVGVFE